MTLTMPPGHDGRRAPRRRRSARRGARAARRRQAGARAAWAWWRGVGRGTCTVREHCTATANGNSTELDPEQAGQRGDHRRASRSSAGLPAPGGHDRHRDRHPGVQAAQPRLRRPGLARPVPAAAVPGLGHPAQIRDPVYATNAFYDVLVKVEGYEDLPITKAAQKVQRSAFPSAYADHEPEARIARLGADRVLPRRPDVRALRARFRARQTRGRRGLDAPRAAVARAQKRRRAGRAPSFLASPRHVRLVLPGKGAKTAAPGRWRTGRSRERRVCSMVASRPTAGGGSARGPTRAGPVRRGQRAGRVRRRPGRLTRRPPSRGERAGRGAVSARSIGT